MKLGMMPKIKYPAFKAVDNELKSGEPVSKKDYVKLSSELQNVMNTPQQLNYNQCIDNLIDSILLVKKKLRKMLLKIVHQCFLT